MERWVASQNSRYTQIYEPMEASPTTHALMCCLNPFFFFSKDNQAHTHKNTHTETNSATQQQSAVHMPLSSEAWECTLSSLGLWWRLWSVAGQAPASSGWGFSFSDGRGEAEKQEWKSPSYPLSSQHFLLWQQADFTFLHASLIYSMKAFFFPFKTDVPKWRKHSKHLDLIQTMCMLCQR